MSGLPDLLRAFLGEALQGLHVSVPARVIAVDAGTQRCSVAPMSTVRVGVDEIPLPVLDDVPIAPMRGGGCTVWLPLSPNDVVTLLFSDRSLEEFRRSGGQTAPRDPRSHSLADAVALPFSVWPDGQPSQLGSTTDIVIGFDIGSTVRITPSGDVVLGGPAATAVALAPLVQAQLVALGPILTALSAAVTAAAAAAADPTPIAASAATTAAAAVAASLQSFLAAWPAPMAAQKVSAL